MVVRLKYKQTELGEIPEEWEIVRLEDISKKIKSGGTPLTSKKEYYNGTIPFVKIEDITNTKKYLSKTSTKITKEGLHHSNAWIVPENSLLIAIYGSLGKTAINKTKLTTNQAILGVLLNEEIVDVEFVYYIINKMNLKRYAKQSTQANLTARIIKNLKIPLPPLQEQKAIAKVLSTVDEAIEKVDKIIEKTERLKKGLMQRLLTKGIGHSKFKKTELGEIPEEWEIVKLGEITNYIKGKKPKVLLESQIGKDYTPYLSTDYLRSNKKTKFAKLDNSIVTVKEGDIILLWDGSNAGEFFIGKKGALSSTMIKFIPKKKFNSYFLFYMLKHKEKLVSTYTKGTGIPHVDRVIIENLKIPLPPLQEQKAIAEVLLTIDKKLELERKRKEKLERIKKGLMNDLLTGRKRVDVEKVLEVN